MERKITKKHVVGAVILNLGVIGFIVYQPITPAPDEYVTVRYEIAHYEGEPVEITAKPVSVEYNEIQNLLLKINLEYDGAPLDARSAFLGRFGEQPNGPDHRKLEQVHKILEERIESGIDSIVVRGHLEDGVLKMYSVGIDGVMYSLLRHSGPEIQ